jgi:capsular exopolysaccharide synthesis family protein
MGLLFGVGAAYVLELLNAGFTTAKQVEEDLDLPVLASISRMSSADLVIDGNTITMPEYPLVRPMSRFSEAIRTLRSATHMSDVDHPPKVLQLTSTVPGEGKSTIGATIAISAAASGLKTLIIDCDLRHPSTSRYFKKEKSPGLVEYLAHSMELKMCVYYDEKLGLWIMPAGGRTQNPPDLLGSDRIKNLISAMRQQFDFIIVDTPPMGPVVDPLIVSNLVDKVIFVVRWASTARELVAHSIQRLSGHRKVAGVVLNHVVDTQAQKYGKYGYSYYYGNKYYKRYYHE